MLRKLPKHLKKTNEISPEDQIMKTRVRCVNGTGIFKFHQDADQDYEYEFVRDGGNNVERDQEDDHQE